MRRTSHGELLRIAALAAALACADAQRHAGVRGGPPWRELVSEHFVVRTDISSESARRLIGQLELDRALLVAAMPALGAAPGRIEADALGSREEYWRVTGQREDYVGHFAAEESGRRRLVLIVSPSGDTRDQALVVAHELAHVLAWHAVPYEPRWFSEGLASYLETVALVRSGQAWLGSAAWKERVAPVPVRELLAWSQEAQNHEMRFYASACGLVRYLDAEQPQGFAELQRRLAAGDGAEAAWNGVFPRWSLAVPGATAELDRQRLLRRRLGLTADGLDGLLAPPLPAGSTRRSGGSRPPSGSARARWSPRTSPRCWSALGAETRRSPHGRARS